MLEESENIVKKTCRELGITQKELAEKIGVRAESLNSSLSRGKITNQVLNSIEMLTKINKLEKKLEDCYKTELTLKTILNPSIKHL